MEAVAAVGLAAAVLQFAEFAGKVVERLADFTAASAGVPRAFRQIATELPLIADALTRLRVQADAGTLDAATEKALLPVVRECEAEARRLAEVLERTLPPKDRESSTWERRRRALASLASDKKVEKAAEALQRYMQTLMFHQVVDSAAAMTLSLHVAPGASAGGGKSGAEAPPPAYEDGFWIVPFDRNASFVGRDKIFDEIDATLDVKKGSQPRAALFGLGGIGKSQIALEYCYRHRQQHPDRSVFWVNAATLPRFEESFHRIATTCNLMSRDNPDDDAAALVQNWLENTSSGRWLMVVDNVDDAPAFFSEPMRTGKTAAEYLPRSDSGAILFTTRSSDAAVDLATPALPISIEQMTKDEGLELVKARLYPGGRSKPTATDEASIIELLSELEYIPLAITQAVAFIAKRRRTVQQYLPQYRSGSTAARARLLGYEFADHGRQGGSLDSVAKTWSISFDAIRDTNSRAADLLCKLSFFQPQGIPEVLLTEPKAGEEGINWEAAELSALSIDDDDDEDRFDFEDAIALLRAYSFLATDESVETPLYSTHRLVQLATRWWISKQGPEAEDRYALAALRSMASAFPSSKEVDHPTYLSRCEGLLPHAEPLLSHRYRNATPLPQAISPVPPTPSFAPLTPLTSSTKTSPSATTDLPLARLLAHTGRYVNFLSSMSLARARFHASYSLRTLHLPPSHPLCLTSMGLLFWMLAVIEHDPSAEPFGQSLLALRRASLGPDHPDTIDALSDLASLIGGIEGREAESERMQREARDMAVRVLGELHPDTINCTAHLASILDDIGRHEEAATYQRSVLAARLASLGPEHPVVLTEECNLAGILSKQSETFGEALEMSGRNLKVKRRVLGGDHSETLVSALNYGVYLRVAGRMEDAAAVYRVFVKEGEAGARRENPHSIRCVEAMRSHLLDIERSVGVTREVLERAGRGEETSWMG